MSLHSMRPSLALRQWMLLSLSGYLHTCKQSDDWYYITKQLFLSREQYIIGHTSQQFI
ncbi:hypothetical protein E2C01_007137 [Portunus trituberculatus]|uniref:Uncharacterized protein n=1 Tax=Portunus trituberculatus TaxID=210409 RepID=A0A5B7D3N5_PORTR|nr:hypothetical protein [Portunus trituberculatus]